jgi:hypothetical protein
VGGVSEPSIVIRLPLEAPPRVYMDALREGEELRLRDWLAAHPELEALISAAEEVAADMRRAA